MEDRCIPVYIFGSNHGLLAMGDGAIHMENGRYYGSFDFDFVHIGSEVTSLSYPLFLVCSADGKEKYPIGDVAFARGISEFVGLVEFKDDNFLHQIMPEVRSITNLD